MRSFWIRLILFLTPFIVGFAMLTGLMVYLGESMPLSLVVSRQIRNDDIIFRYRYGNRDQQFKILSINQRQPTVLALGSSRILQFRAGFFNQNPEIFYNGAAPGWGLEQILHVLSEIDQASLPQLLILSIDQPWFNDRVETNEFPDDINDISNIFMVNRSILRDFIQGIDFSRYGFDIVDYLVREDPGESDGQALGMRAIRDGHGFRSDGSEQYGDFLIADWLSMEQQRIRHKVWMREGRRMYAYGDRLSEERLEQINELLDFASVHNIMVIGFLPPYAPALWTEMMERGNHSYMTILPPRIEDIFAQYGFAFFDFSDGNMLGVRDDQFFDGWHASELVNLQMYLIMLSALPDLLGSYSDYDRLLEIITNATSTWDVFGIDNSLPD